MTSPRRLKIYVAGPYSDDNPEIQSQNVESAIEVGVEIWKRGHYPYVPHLTHFVDLYAREKGIPMGWKEYIEWDRPWLKHCDALYYIGSSKGADLELFAAKALGLTIYEKINEIPKIAEERSPPTPDYESSQVYVRFIDILFAVVLGQSFPLVSSVSLDPLANAVQLSTFFLMYVLVVTSWYGYHFSSLRVQSSTPRWIVDIILLFIYYAGFVTASRVKPDNITFVPVLLVFDATFVLYTVWSVVRLTEYRKTARFKEFRQRLFQVMLFTVALVVATVGYLWARQIVAGIERWYLGGIFVLLLLYRVPIRRWKALASAFGQQWKSFRMKRKH